MTDIFDEEILLPDTCWHSAKTGEPWPMHRRDGVVLHKISGIYKFPDAPFDLDQIVEKLLVPYRLSYNGWITREGIARRLVPDGIQAFHAGRSRFDGEDYCNRFMDGIALISTGKSRGDGEDYEPAFTEHQLERLARLLAGLMRLHGWGQDRITSHQYVRAVWNGAYPEKAAQSRYGDPGDLPWDRVRARVRELL